MRLAKKCLAIVGVAVAASAGCLPAATAGAATAVQARRAPSALAGYVWSTSTAPSGPIASYYAYDPGGPVTVVKQFPGFYQVTFAGLGSIVGPSFAVTTYDALATCNPVLQGSSAGNFGVDVQCSSFSGTAEDARFDLAITKATDPKGVFDYATVGRFYGRLTGPFDYNSSHKVNSVRHLGAGLYQVSMPGPATTGTTGTVQVTDDSTADSACEVTGWHGTRAGQVIGVDCFSDTGARHNEVFTITYARGNNLLGLNGATAADAFASRPTAARYQPATQYDSHRHARVIVVRLGLGSYQVTFRGSAGPASSNGGHVQLSTIGHTDDHCYVVYWAQQQVDPYARVDCVTSQGAPADSPFTIQWIVA